MLLNVWAKAFDELMRELAASEGKSRTIQNWRQFLQVWSSLFDRVFAETFRSQDTVEIQGKFLNAALTYRLHQQQLMEVFLKMNDLPTRSEVDEVHRSIYEMRKEIKSLKKAVAESQGKELGWVQSEAKWIQLSSLWVGAGLPKNLDLNLDFRSTCPYKVFVQEVYSTYASIIIGLLVDWYEFRVPIW